MSFNLTLATVKSDALKRGSLSGIIQDILANDFTIRSETFRWMNASDVEFLYQEHVNAAYFPRLWDSVKRGAYLMVLANKPMMFASDQQVNEAMPTWMRWRRCLTEGPLLCSTASLRLKYGNTIENPADNALHGSDSEAAARREVGHFFPAFLEE